MSIRTEKNRLAQEDDEEETDWKKKLHYYSRIGIPPIYCGPPALRQHGKYNNICTIQGVRVISPHLCVVSHISFLRISRNVDMAETVDLL